jgi:hypothetical protein
MSLSTAQRPVVILGAGATKACGGPLTGEILPATFLKRETYQLEREGYLQLLESFLIENFHVPTNIGERHTYSYPGLPLLLSLIDTAIDRKQPLGASWSVERLEDVRSSLEYAIFALLEAELRQGLPSFHDEALQKVFRFGLEPHVISLNYDIIIDNSMVSANEGLGGPFPDYGCDFSTEYLERFPLSRGKLLKLHGSLNWLYCPACHRLDLGLSESGTRTTKQLDALYQVEQQFNLEKNYSCKGSPCPDCNTPVRPILITPTHHKDYRNPHVSRVWYEAERLLRKADHAVFIGYSLPDDDVEVAYLFKRGLAHLLPDAVTVVEYDPQNRLLQDNPVGLRYRTLFGDGLDWHSSGFGPWVQGLPN